MSTAPAELEAATSIEQTHARPFVASLAVIGILLPALAHLPILWSYASSLYSLPQYGYILTLPVFATVLAYSRVRHLGTLTPGNFWVSFGWFISAALLLATSSVFDSPWLGGISSFWAMTAIGYALGGRRLLVAILPSWVMLCLAIRLPMLLDEQLVQVLQSIAARRASALLHYIGQAHILDGNVVETPTKRYLVEEACSGIQSLFAITACTVFYILWTRMSWWRAILILVVSWFWVWTANVARIVLVAYLNSTMGLPVDKGWMHDALAVGLFALTLGLIVSSAHLIWFFLPYGIFGGRDGSEESADADASTLDGPTRLSPPKQTIFASPFFQVFYAALLLFIWLPQLRIPNATASPVQLNGLEESFAPESFKGWTRAAEGFQSLQRKDDSQWGAHSQSWRYRKGNKKIIVSLDYPFLGWHELATCYAADGWTIDQRLVVPVPEIPGKPEAINPGERFVNTSMRRPEQNDYCFVVYQCFNDRRMPIPVPEGNIFRLLSDRLKTYRRRLATLGASGSGMNDQVRTYQLQVILQDLAAPTETDRLETVALFMHFRGLLHSTLTPLPAGGMP
ncbi:MAG: exosortase U [Planctomycetia bacterium]|nr:exosortase U [Planctomycetia bacterium]